MLICKSSFPYLEHPGKIGYNSGEKLPIKP